MLKRFWKDESGASAAEYALVLAIVTAGMAGAVIALEEQISIAINEAADCIEGTDDCESIGGTTVSTP